MVVGFLDSLKKYWLTFLFARWRLSVGCNGQAKAMVNKSGFSQIKKNMNKLTIYTK